MVVLYDVSSDPISGTQRRGRTGRKRSGDVIILLTKDFEESKFKRGSTAKRNVEGQLYNRENYMTHKYNHAPRMVPDDIKPICLEQYVQPVDDEPEPAKAVKRQPKKGVTVTASSKSKKKKCVEGADSSGFVSAKQLDDNESKLNQSNVISAATDDIEWESDDDDVLRAVFDNMERRRSLSLNNSNDS